MTGRFSLRPQAELDVEDIWLEIAPDDMGAANRMVDRFTQIFVMLGDNPEAGRRRPELGRDIRSFAVGSYVAFYIAHANGAEILRVMHGARDIAGEDMLG